MKLGDSVTLEYDSGAGAIGYVCADGIADRRVVCMMTSPHAAGSFGDTLFRLSPPCAYEAARALEKFAAAAGGDGGDTAGREPRLRALREAAASEAAANAELAASLIGAPVLYGSSLQLQHVKSGKLLAVVPKSVSLLEPASALVTLRASGSAECLFIVRPRFKLRQEGDRVAAGDCVVLVSARTAQALHVSAGQLDAAGTLREVSASAVSRAGLRVVPYAEQTDALGSIVHGGDMVRLWHAEAEGALALDPRAWAAVAAAAAAAAAPEAPDASYLSRAVYVRVPPAGSDAEGQAGSNSVWAVELELSEGSRLGGPTRWLAAYEDGAAPSVAVRLRHVGTGAYLALEESDAGDTKTSSGACAQRCCARLDAGLDAFGWWYGGRRIRRGPCAGRCPGPRCCRRGCRGDRGRLFACTPSHALGPRAGRGQLPVRATQRAVSRGEGVRKGETAAPCKTNFVSGCRASRRGALISSGGRAASLRGRTRCRGGTVLACWG